MTNIFEEYNRSGEPIDFRRFYLNVGTMWVPRSVEIVSSDEFQKKIEKAKSKTILTTRIRQKLREQNFIEYPVHIWQYESSLARSAPLLLWQIEHKQQWKEKNRTHNLLYDFCSLADDDVDTGRVKEFILHWGPLWICNTDYWDEGTIPCIWQPHRIVVPDSLCKWFPFEPVNDLKKAARWVNAVREITAKLRGDEEISSALWERIVGEYYFNNGMELGRDETITFLSKAGPEDQKRFLADRLDFALGMTQAGRLSFEWEASGKPMLKFHAGWGFFRAVLVELAGELSGGYAIYRCDRCKGLIFPEERQRKPKEGHRIYCEQCRPKRSADSMRVKRQQIKKGG